MERSFEFCPDPTTHELSSDDLDAILNAVREYGDTSKGEFSFDGMYWVSRYYRVTKVFLMAKHSITFIVRLLTAITKTAIKYYLHK